MTQCMKRCCITQRMDEALDKLLEKEFPNDGEYKTSGVTTNHEQVNIHIDHDHITLDFIRKIEALHYRITNMWAQAHTAISIAVVPDKHWLDYTQFKQERGT